MGGLRNIFVLGAFLLGTAGVALLFSPAHGHALNGDDFNAGRIIDDDVFTNKNSMSPREIQNFLVGKDSACLKDFKTLTLHDADGDGNADEPYGKGNGNKARASKVIWQASQIYDINPQVLLVTLQKEQGLVTRDDCPDWRYQTALGYGCPDDQPCDKSAYGFTRQLDYGSWHFRGFFNDSLTFVPYTPGKHDVAYNPDGSCGSSTVHIRNRATAALYSYTPYQPNQAALNNLDGLGNSCSAYGNRNFWRDFTRWFGNPTPGNQILLLRDEDTHRIYLIRGHKRIHIATVDAYRAWGFNKLPVTTVSSSTINEYTPATYKLRRFGLMAGTNKRFFVDGQNGYRMKEKSADVWQFPMDEMPAVPKATIQYLNKRQKLPYLVNSPVSNKVYMMDGGTLRHYPNSRVLKAWEPSSRSANISERYFCKSGNEDTCTPRWRVGEKLGFPKATTSDTSKIYFINQGNKHWVSSIPMNKVYGGDVSGVSQATLDRFFDAPRATALLSRTYNSKVYLLNGDTRHHIGGPSLYNHWKPNGNGRKTNVSKAFLNMLDRGRYIDRFAAMSDGTPYYINQKKYDLDDINTDDPIELKPAAAKLYGNDKLSTPLVTSGRTSKIFLLGDRNKHHVSSIFDLKNIRSNTGLGVMKLPHSLLKNMEAGPRASYEFKDNEGDTYVFDNGSLRKVTSDKWSLDPNLTLDTERLREWFEEKDAVDSGGVRIGDRYGAMRNGTLFTDRNKRLGALWKSDDSSPAISQRLASRFEEKPLSPFVTSPNSPHIYLYNGTDFSYVSDPATLYNLGYKRFNGVMTLPKEDIVKSDHSASYLLNRDEGIMDDGQRRHFATENTADDWVAQGEVSSLAGSSDSQDLIALLTQKTNSTDVNRLITSSRTSKYFCMEDGKKRWVTSPSALKGSSCKDERLRGISHNLLKQIPTGNNI